MPGCCSCSCSSPFIAYFNYSRVPQVAAVKLGELIAVSSIGDIWLLLAAMLITLIVA